MNGKTKTSVTGELGRDLDGMGKLIAAMDGLHGGIKGKLELEWRRREERMQQMATLTHEFQGFRRLFSEFRSECKEEWMGVYKQLLEIIRHIVELYQLKIGKLENKIEAQQQIISQLTSRKKLSTQGLQFQSQFDSQYQESLQLSQCKKVKISDVIASYQSSILTNTPEDNTFQQLRIEADNGQRQNRDSEFCRFEKVGSKQMLSLIGSMSNYHSRGNRPLNCSLQQKQNHPNFISSCRKISDAQQEGRREASRTGRNKPKQTESASKLSQLRRYLYNRKRI